MFIQKVFHVHHGIEETKARLSKLQAYSRKLDGVQKAILTADGVGQFDCELPHGLRAHCVLVGLPTDDENQILFKSTTGNVNLSGLLEFWPVRDNLTEVQLTVEYGFTSPLCNMVDRFFRCVERFFHRQLSILQIQVEGALTCAGAKNPTGFIAHLPQLAR